MIIIILSIDFIRIKHIYWIVCFISLIVMEVTIKLCCLKILAMERTDVGKYCRKILILKTKIGRGGLKANGYCSLKKTLLISEGL